MTALLHHFARSRTRGDRPGGLTHEGGTPRGT